MTALGQSICHCPSRQAKSKNWLGAFRNTGADVYSDQRQLNGDSRKLYGLLIKPVVPFLHSKRLLIEADGMLDGIALKPW